MEGDPRRVCLWRARKVRVWLSFIGAGGERERERESLGLIRSTTSTITPRLIWLCASCWVRKQREAYSLSVTVRLIFVQVVKDGVLWRSVDLKMILKMLKSFGFFFSSAMFEVVWYFTVLADNLLNNQQLNRITATSLKQWNMFAPVFFCFCQLLHKLFQ